MADWLATVMMLAAATAVLVVPLAALASGAVLSASPATASGGDRIRIVGTGFPRGEEGVLTWDGEPAGIAPYRANGAGRFQGVDRRPNGRGPWPSHCYRFHRGHTGSSHTGDNRVG